MNKPLVLVVEDDAPVRNLITTTLKTHEYRYLSAQNGASAVMEALSHNPDIVLLDLGLPDMDGVEIIRKIRSWSNMPIIVISARTEDSDKIVALDAGADDYLTKPFSVDELLARLRVTQRRLSLMKTDAAQESPIFTNGALKIDYAAGCAYLDGAELHLTPIEYKLLCLLSKNVGKVLTHTYITQQIWGSSWENDIASLLLCGCSWRPCAKSWNAEKTGSNTYKRTSESAIGCSASNSREAFKKSMNHYAVENLFGIEGLNIAWYGIIITFGMILGFMLALRRCKKPELNRITYIISCFG